MFQFEESFYVVQVQKQHMSQYMSICGAYEQMKFEEMCEYSKKQTKMK